MWPSDTVANLVPEYFYGPSGHSTIDVQLEFLSDHLPIESMVRQEISDRG